MHGNLGLIAKPGGELADDQPDGEHDGEGEDVLQVRDGERQRRRHQEVVERQHVDKGGERRRAASVAQRDSDHRKQVQHHDVGRGENARQREDERGADAAGKQRDDVARRLQPAPDDLGQRGVGRRLGTSASCRRHADLDQVDVGSEPAELLGQGAGRSPEAGPVVTHDKLGQIVLACVVDDGRRDLSAREDRRRRAELLGELDRREDALAACLGQALQGRRLDVDRVPGDGELLREQGGASHHMLGALGPMQHRSADSVFQMRSIDRSLR